MSTRQEKSIKVKSKRLETFDQWRAEGGVKDATRGVQYTCIG